MAIVIPAIVDTVLAALKVDLKPVYHSDTHTFTSSRPPYALGNRVAELFRLLTGLVDAGPLTATGGTATSVQDAGAFTGVNSLVGAKVTFTGNVTPALAGRSAYVVSNTTNALFFAPGAIPGTPQAGDTYSVEFSSVDQDLVALEGSKGLGDSQSNPYGPGPSMVNALMKLIVQLGGALPSWLDYHAAEAFHIGSPHAGAGSYGQGGAILLAEALQLVRDTLAAYTKPT